MSAIAPLTKENAAEKLNGLYDGLTKRLGKMPNFYATMAHRPDVLEKFLDLYKAIMSQGSVEARYKELVYLKTAVTNGCEYCTRAHAASAKRHGVTDEQIQALLFYRRSPLFDDKEKAVILLAERLARGASAMRDGSVEDLRKYFADDEIVELVLVSAVANFTNRFNDGLQVEPDLG